MKNIFALLLFVQSAGSYAWAQSDLNSLSAGAKNDKEVVWYTTTSAGDNQAIVAGFNKKYPFLKVQVLRSTGEKLRQRVLAETQGGQFFSDVLSVSSMEMGLLKSRNLLQPYDPPEAESYPANARDKEKAFTAIYARNFVMGYNTAMLSEKERPRDWSDLLAPFWKGKFAMDEEEFEWFGTLVDYWGREKAGKFIRALAAQQPQRQKPVPVLRGRVSGRRPGGAPSGFKRGERTPHPESPLRHIPICSCERNRGGAKRDARGRTRDGCVRAGSSRRHPAARAS